MTFNLQEIGDTFLRDRIEELLQKERNSEARLQAIASLHYRAYSVEDICAEDRYPWPCPTITFIRATPATDSKGYEEMLEAGGK